MIDAAIPQPPSVEPRAPLRPVAWGELVARFDAIRDLRRVGRGIGHRASFDPTAARRLFDHGKASVNLDALEARKPTGPTQSASTQPPARTDRETT